MQLSLVVIACDEADRIGRCLESVRCADEVIVVDSGSRDRTVEIARDLGARVVQTDWPGHTAQKNRALVLAAGEWVLSLDADEYLSTQAAESLRAAIEAPGDAVGFSMNRRNIWLGKPLRHGRWYPDTKVRVVRRDFGSWGGVDPHDQLEVRGPVRLLRGDIIHHPYRDFAEHLATIDRYSAVHARALADRGVRGHWWDVAVRPPLHFVDAYLLRAGFLDGAAGLAVAGLGAGHVALKWARLRRLKS